MIDTLQSWSNFITVEVSWLFYNYDSQNVKELTAVLDVSDQ
jgi:hypothetical protein